MTHFLNTMSPVARSVLFGALGLIVGNLLCHWVVWLTEPMRPPDSLPVLPRNRRPSNWTHRIPLVGSLLAGGNGCDRGQPIERWWLWCELGTAVLFAAFTAAYFDFHCQQTPEVRPEERWRIARCFYQLVLISLLVAATATDLRDYTISDWITLPGLLIGILGAAASGDLQMVHVWVDWNDPLVELNGPYLPDWMKEHQHWHGLAWSVCGLAAGAGITSVVWALSRLILGREAMGFGDVTLMAMIGSFVGWQPVVFIFLLAPLCGLAISVPLRLMTGKTFLPYGPYLSAAALVVLFAWRWIWMLELKISADRTFSIRRLMGDWQTLLLLAAISTVALAGLLLLVRLYRLVPVPLRRDPP